MCESAACAFTVTRAPKISDVGDGQQPAFLSEADCVIARNHMMLILRELANEYPARTKLHRRPTNNQLARSPPELGESWCTKCTYPGALIYGESAEGEHAALGEINSPPETSCPIGGSHMHPPPHGKGEKGKNTRGTKINNARLPPTRIATRWRRRGVVAQQKGKLVDEMWMK